MSKVTLTLIDYKCALFRINLAAMEVQEGFSGVPRFSVSVSNGSVMVVPLPQGQGTEASQLHQIPTHVLNEQV